MAELEIYILMGIVISVWITGVWLFRRDVDKKIAKEQYEMKQYHQYYEDTE